jgi:hypothetical protein
MSNIFYLTILIFCDRINLTTSERQVKNNFKKLLTNRKTHDIINLSKTKQREVKHMRNLSENEIKIGLEVIYNGKGIEWSDGTKLKQGRYVVGNIRNNAICLKANRKNATTEYRIYKSDFKPIELNFDDITNYFSVVFNLRGKEWIVDNKELFAKAKKYNKNH